jgi:hypothetical protein
MTQKSRARRSQRSPTRSSVTCSLGSAGRSTGAGLSGPVDRCDCREGPRQPGRQPTGLCRDRREPRRRTRCSWPLAWPHRRGGRQAMDEHAERAQEPRCLRRADRLLRRLEGAPGRDPRHLTTGHRPDVRRSPGPQQSALRLKETLADDHPAAADDLHRSNCPGSRGAVRRLQRGVEGALPQR